MALHHIQIDGHRDFELGVNVPRKLDYSINIPKNASGLVVYIAGFGEDAAEYRKKFQIYASETYQLACLTVDYHCLFSRPQLGAQVAIEDPILNMLRGITGLLDGDVDSVLNRLKEIQPDPNIKIRIPATIYPLKNEYQNFGVLPALDHIYAINDVFSRFPEIPKKVMAIGSSYGGYIANLVSKFAPRTLNAVFDNSSWADPVLNFIVGAGMGIREFYLSSPPNVILQINTVSPWSHLRILPNAFNTDRLIIRAFPPEHIRMMAEAGKRKTLFRWVHSEKDDLADPQRKAEFAREMKKNGFDLQLIMYTEKDVDGRYIKTAAHGMDLSMRQFFATCYKEVKDRLSMDQTIDYDYPHTLDFRCETLTYQLTYPGNAQPRFKVLDLDPIA